MPFQQIDFGHFVCGHIGKGAGNLPFPVIPCDCLGISGIIKFLLINFPIINYPASLLALHNYTVGRDHGVCVFCKKFGVHSRVYIGHFNMGI